MLEYYCPRLFPDDFFMKNNQYSSHKLYLKDMNIAMRNLYSGNKLIVYWNKLRQIEIYYEYIPSINYYVLDINGVRKYIDVTDLAGQTIQFCVEEEIKKRLGIYR